MEQYEIHPKRYYRILCDALKYFKAEHIFIRLVGSHGGTVKVDKFLFLRFFKESRGGIVLGKTVFNKLKLKQSKKGLHIIIDGKERFLFETVSEKKYGRIAGKNWSITYFRVNEEGVMHFAHTGYPDLHEPYTGPDDPRLPEAKQTIFRAVNRDHFIQITFSGKIPIRRTDKLVSNIPGWYYHDLNYAKIRKLNKSRTK